MKKPVETPSNAAPEAASEAKAPRATPTPDGHHVVIDGRKWRATNPNLTEEARQTLVNELMNARRGVGAALKSGDKAAESAARARVNAAKIGLGERGPKWWEEAPANAPSSAPSNEAAREATDGAASEAADGARQEIEPERK